MTANSANSDGRVRVAYFDDQLLFREALASVLEETGVISVVHSSKHGGEDLHNLLDIPVSALLVSLDAQSNDPMGTVRQARHVVPELSVCALVAADRLDRAREAIGAGCKGVVSTSATINLLVAALETLSHGQPYVDPSLAGRLLARTAGKAGAMRDNGKTQAASQLAPATNETARK